MSVPLVDAIGQEFSPRRPRRIVSLVPSLTETLFAYGLGDAVAGVTRYCIEPAMAVASLPKVGGTKDPDLSAVLGLEPDLVIASSEENRKQDVEALLGAGLCVYVTLPETVEAAAALLADLATLVNAKDAATPLLAEIQAALAEVREATQGAPPVPYFCPIWRRPYMASGPGTYPFDLLRVCGGVSVCGAGVARYFAVELADVAAARPEVILLPDEPYPFGERHKAEFRLYPEVPAVAGKTIYCIDGRLLTWYGPRIPAALRTLHEHLAAVREQRRFRRLGP